MHLCKHFAGATYCRCTCYFQETKGYEKKTTILKKTKDFCKGGAVGLQVQREGQHLLSPFQLMCGMGATLVSVVVSRDKLQLLGVPQI